MNGSGCKNCPVNPCETMNYRGSTCAAQRAKFGLGDPQTNADRIRAMSDEEIAKIFTSAVADGCPPKIDWDCAKDEYGWDACDACWCKWLQQPAEE